MFKRFKKGETMDKKPIWSEVSNTHTETSADFGVLHGDAKFITMIDSWLTSDDNEEGKVIAQVIKSKSGDICIAYIDSRALWDEAAQEKIKEAVEALKKMEE
jgi:hypothetical protein